MKYYRFFEDDPVDGRFAHYMRPHEARMLIETHFMSAGPASVVNAERYETLYSRDIAPDYRSCAGGLKDDSELFDDLVQRCLQVLGFGEIQVIESDIELEPIYHYDNDRESWVPDVWGE